MRHPSDSQAQRDAEAFVLGELSRQEGVIVAPASVRLGDGPAVDVDGFNEAHRLVCEVYAHIGRTRGGQNHKIAHDILKLWAIEQFCGGGWRKLLCFVDAEARQAAANNSWLAWLCQSLGIEARLVPLSPALREGVSEAQQKQVMVNRRESGA
jgi:hypothetical protein